jgi:hypothetical protein
MKPQNIQVVKKMKKKNKAAAITLALFFKTAFKIYVTNTLTSGTE